MHHGLLKGKPMMNSFWTWWQPCIVRRHSSWKSVDALSTSDVDLGQSLQQLLVYPAETAVAHHQYMVS